jgi:sarcosine oxidase, subunit beta
VSAVRTADAVVIGAGVLGAATTLALAREGLRVALLEREAPNRGGSGATAGNLHIQVVHARRPGQEVPVDTERFLPLQVAASGLWEELDRVLEGTIELRRSGGFTVAEHEHEVTELESKRRIERAHGLHTELLDGEAARAALPLLGPTVAAATFCADDGYANPLLATPAMVEAARRLGAEVHGFSPVTAIRRIEESWTVLTPRAAWSAPVVINVAGPWMAGVCALAGIDLDIRPIALQMHATERLAPTLEHLVQHIGDGLSVKQVTAGNVLIGGGWPAATVDLVGRSLPSMESLFGNLALAQRILPFLRSRRILRVWAGALGATPDEMPVVGEVPGYPGFLVAGGTYAFTFAPLWASVLCSLATGESPRFAVDDLGPGRLVRGMPEAGHEQPRTRS